METSLIQWCFIILFCGRYIRLVGNVIAHWRYKSIPILPKPTYSCEDITVIVPTINIDLEKLGNTIRSILACHPFEIYLVTQESEFAVLNKFAKAINVDVLRILKLPFANKRHQICQAIPRVKTKITVFVDDDVKWPSTLLPWLLAPFEDLEIGGVGTCQRVRRLKAGTLAERCYNWLAMAYIERRNFEISATHWIDGGTSCMSGRTHALRTEIVKSPTFLAAFQNERWGKNLLNADDDNFVTRWLFENSWKTWVQYNEYCEVETTLENSSKFVNQCSRWARSNWRSNLITLTQGLWKLHPWCCYTLYLTMFINFASLVDPLLFGLCIQSTASYNEGTKNWCRAAFLCWWLSSKVIKLIGLFKRHSWDILFLVVSIIFGYVHSGIKFWALLTLHKVGVSRDGICEQKQTEIFGFIAGFRSAFIIVLSQMFRTV